MFFAGDRMKRRSALDIVFLFFLLCAPAMSFVGEAAAASAQSGNAPSASADIDGPDADRAPVTLDGKVLFQVRGLPAYPAKERAAVISQRIKDVAADETIPLDAFRISELEDRTRITAGDRLVAGFVDADAAPEGATRQLLAERALIKIKEAISAFRSDRSPRALLIATAYALAALAIAALLLFLIQRLFRKLHGIGEQRLKKRIEALEAQSHQIVQARQLNKALHGILRGLHIAALVALTYSFFHFVLSLYPWTRPLSVRLLAIFLEPLESMALGFLDSLPGIAFVIVLAIVTRYVLRLTQLYFESIDRGTITLSRFDREWALPTYKIARLVIIALAAVVAYPYIPGSNSEAFKGISIFLGLMISLGSSSIIGNLMAGYAMIYRRAFKVGDRISIENITGDVTEKRLMVTHLRTIKNEEVVVPNSTIINSSVVNYSTLAATRGLILHTTVGIGYETPWRQVEAMLLLAAARTPGLLKEPAAFVLQKSLGDFAVTYELNAYCDNAQAMAHLYTAMHQNVLDIFNEHGVQIMTPAYEGDPEKPKVVPRDQWYQAPAHPPETVSGDGAQAISSGALASSK
jgi:small-conductance mechanosensitive channel